MVVYRLSWSYTLTPVVVFCGGMLLGCGDVCPRSDFEQ